MEEDEWEVVDQPKFLIADIGMMGATAESIESINKNQGIDVIVRTREMQEKHGLCSDESTNCIEVGS